FVGGYILEALQNSMPREEVRVFARRSRDLDKLRSQGYDVAVGSVTNLDQLRRAVQGVETVVHLVAIIREVPKRGQTFDRVIGEGTENMAKVAKEAGVKPIISM